MIGGDLMLLLYGLFIAMGLPVILFIPYFFIFYPILLFTDAAIERRADKYRSKLEERGLDSCL